jgi:hypothetical protein
MTGRHARRSATVKYSLSEVSKTIAGFLVPAATVLISAVTSPSDGGSTITNAEWVTAACAAIITAGTVFGVKNKPAKGQPAKPDVSEVEADPTVTALSHLDADDEYPPENYRG